MAKPAPVDVEPDPELEGSRMPFLAHLRELRDRVRNAAIFFVLGFFVCFYFADQIYEWLKQPLFEVWRTNPATKHIAENPTMAFGTLTEPFWVNMSIAMWAGIFVASPFIFFQLWRFIAPGLYKKEQRIVTLFAVSSAVFFTGGALFCYHMVLGRLFDFLLGYANESQTPVIMMQGYLDLTRDMMLAFGAIFELPLLIAFMSMIGIVTHRGLWKFNRWFVVIAFIVGAILTPSPDAISQIMMAGPMIALYNLSIVIAYFITKRKERGDRELEARERAADEKERAERAAKRERERERE